MRGKWKKLEKDEIKKRRGKVLQDNPPVISFSGYLINKFNYSIIPVKFMARSSFMLKLEFIDGLVYEVVFRKIETLNKPKARLVHYYPFKHLSNLYPIMMDGKQCYLFDDGKKGYLWEDLDNPKAYKPITSNEYMKLKEQWHKHQLARLVKQGGER